MVPRGVTHSLLSELGGQETAAFLQFPEQTSEYKNKHTYQNELFGQAR